MTLRARLTLIATLAVTVALVIGAFALTAVITHQRVAALDDVVNTRVVQVVELIQADRIPDVLPVAEPGEVVQILNADGAVIASSATASQTLPLLPAAELFALGDASTEHTVVRGSTQGSYGGDVRVAVRSVAIDGEQQIVAASVPLGEIRGLVGALQVALFGVVPVLAGSFGLVVWYLLGAYLAPVEQLRSAAEQIARVGGSGALPLPPRADELHALASTLNDMLDRLESAAHRQRRFVADAAHELRSPLAALRVTAEVAAAHPGSTSVPELASDLVAELLRLQRLVDDLLVLARVGAVPRSPQIVDLLDVVADASVQVPSRAGISVEVVGAGTAFADADDLARALRNLVENAVRHTANTVTISVRPELVTVDDDGSGISEEDRERAFERFVRFDGARQRDAGGSGLGLAIARELVREVGGDIVLGESPGGGLRVEVRLVSAT